MADPANVLALDDIQMATGLTCRVAVASEEDIEALIGRLNTLQSAVSEAIEEEEDEAAPDEAELTELRESAEDAPVIKLVHSILGQAVTEGASDIHFEPDEGDMRVRFRVDGVLHEAARVPKRMVAGVVSRVKIMSELDIAEKRLPQDGRVSINVEDAQGRPANHDPPTQRGEGCTIRILDQSQAMRSLDDLGMDGEGAGPLRGLVPQALRRDPRHRPDGLGQDDDALRRARRSSTTSTRTSSRSRTRSSTGSRASTRSASTARPA